MMEKRDKNPPEKMTDKEILEDVLGRQSVCLFGWGRSPSKSGKKHATEESGRPSYNQVFDELKEYKSHLKVLKVKYK